jgi:soluble calcium-activated nucleotidase 1
VARDRSHRLHAPHHAELHNATVYKIACVADMDKVSKFEVDGKTVAWMSVFKTLSIERTEDGRYRLKEFLAEKPLVSRLSEADRGMELSELLYFHGRLLALSDRTGVVYEVKESLKLVPLWILPDEDGMGFKSEWATIGPDDKLYVGSTGKAWTENGKLLSENRLWVKQVSAEGQIEHLHWGYVYEKLRKFTGTLKHGFVIHEAVNFNPMDRRWYFLPRRLSEKQWTKGETTGNHLLISCDEYFDNWNSVALGKPHLGHGWSSFKFIPFREHEIIALKTEETADDAHTDLEVINVVTGEILLFVKLGHTKYEGVAIVPPNSAVE